MRRKLFWGRLIAFTLIITLLIPAGFAARQAKAESAVTGVIRATELFMREGAGTEYANVKVDGKTVVLTYGQEVTVLGESNGWYYLRAVFEGSLVTGYSLSSRNGVVFIEIPDGTTLTGAYKKGKVTASTLNVRKGPSTEYDKVQLNGSNLVLTSGQEVSVIEEKDGWYHLFVTVGGVRAEGYCLGKYIEVEEGGTFSEPEYDEGRITATKLNVRKGPGTGYDILKAGGSNVTLGYDHKITIIEKVDDWYHITSVFNGNLIEGYCLGDYVEITGKKNGGDKPADPVGDDSDKGNDPDKNDNTDTHKSDDTTAPGQSDDTSYVPTSPTDLSHGVPDGYELASKKYSAKYAISAKVNAKTGLNLRRTAVEGSEVVTVLPDSTPVTIINSKTVDVTDSQGKTVSERWYHVVVDQNGEYISGYVVSTYIEITDFSNVTVTNLSSKRTVYKKLTSATKLKDSSGAKITLPKKTMLTVVGDYTDNSGAKRFKVNFEYKGKEYTGYILASKVSLVSTISSYTVQYLVKKENVNTPENDDPDDDPKDPLSGAFAGANAVVKEAAGLAVRISPKTSSEMIYTPQGKAVLLYTGDVVEIIDVTVDGSKIWCYIRLFFNNSEYFGYIRSTHLESDVLISLLSNEDHASTAPLDFEAKLEKEGFPESYKERLRELHQQYPLWEFTAYHTGLDWNEAVASESEVGMALLPNNYSVEWLSFEQGAYSWKTDKFTVFDGSYWVAASVDAVKYYMDPRNWLTPTGIFMFELLSYNPNIQTADGAADILKTTAFGNGAAYSYKDDFGTKRKATYVDTFTMAAEYSGVSLYHLVSRSKNEIGNGTPSNSVSGTVSGYEGLYNFYNVGANDSAIPGQNIINGLKFAKNGRGSETMNQLYLIPWSNPFRAILGGAFYIGYNYVNKGQDTLYFERFNVVADGAYSPYTHQYMTNVAAAATESLSTSRGYENPEAMALEFSIPVYLNMPEEVCVAPEKAYNPNNWLKTLNIRDSEGNDLLLTPTFDYTAKQTYSMIVDHTVSKVYVDAETVSKLATVTSKSSFSLDYGDNLVTIKVKAENGDTRKYKIHIFREEDPDAVAEENNDNTGDSENSGTADSGNEENNDTPENNDPGAGEPDGNGSETGQDGEPEETGADSSSEGTGDEGSQQPSGEEGPEGSEGSN